MSASETVQSIYAAFGRGDVPAILALMDPEVEIFVHAPASVPYAGRRRGHEEAGRWFGELAGAVRHDRVEPETMIASDDEVAVRGIEAGTANATGRRYESGFVHFWKLRDGLVVRFDDFLDSAKLAAALAG